MVFLNNTMRDSQQESKGFRAIETMVKPGGRQPQGFAEMGSTQVLKGSHRQRRDRYSSNNGHIPSTRHKKVNDIFFGSAIMS